MRRWLIRIFFPGWVALACSSQRAACYSEADVWLIQKSDECKARGYKWEACPERPEFLKQHRERQAQCP